MARADFTDEAVADLRSIIAYSTDRWGADQARTYVAGLRRLCGELADMPMLGMEVDWLAPGLRRFPCRSHILYYRETGSGIVVIAVIHKRQEPDRRLPR